MRNLLLLFYILCASESFARLPDLIPFRKGDLWGYCDSTKRILIAPRFQEVSFFSGGTAAVVLEGKCGLIDSAGKIILPCVYPGISDEAHRGNRLVRSKDTENNTLINVKGDTLIPAVDGYLMWIAADYLLAVDCSRKERVTAVFDCNGKQLTPYQYTENNYYPGFFASSWLLGEHAMMQLQKGKHSGVIDSTGKVIVPFEYDRISFSQCGVPLFTCTKGKKTIYLGMDGNELKSFEPCKTHQPPAAIKQAGSKSYYNNAWQDSSGNIHTLPDLLEAGPFRNGYAVFGVKGLKYGIVDENFRVVIPARYTTVMGFDENGLSFVRLESDVITGNEWKHGRTGYIDIYGNEYWED